MKRIERKEFLIVKYILFMKKKGIPPLIASLAFGSSFFTIAYMGFRYYNIPFSFGYFSCLAWLFIGPFLIYEAGKIADDLWPHMLPLLSSKEIRELQKYEKRYYGKGYLLITVPCLLGCTAIILNSLSSFPHNGLIQSFFSPFVLFYFFSWLVLAFLGSYGIWGTIQLILMIRKFGNSKAKLDPYHHDRFGGLHGISDVGLKITIMYSTGALMIPMVYELAIRTYISRQIFPFALGFSSFYSFTVFLSFLIQTIALNKVALRSKKHYLEIKGKRCKELREECDKNESTDNLIRFLVEHASFEQISQMRVYTFDTDIILKLTASLLIPLIIGTFRLWLPWIPAIS